MVVRGVVGHDALLDEEVQGGDARRLFLLGREDLLAEEGLDDLGQVPAMEAEVVISPPKEARPGGQR